MWSLPPSNDFIGETSCIEKLNREMLTLTDFMQPEATKTKALSERC
jgi:hypothetical protein